MGKEWIIFDPENERRKGVSPTCPRTQNPTKMNANTLEHKEISLLHMGLEKAGMSAAIGRKEVSRNLEDRFGQQPDGRHDRRRCRCGFSGACEVRNSWVS